MCATLPRTRLMKYRIKRIRNPILLLYLGLKVSFHWITLRSGFKPALSEARLELTYQGMVSYVGAAFRLTVGTEKA